jgi:hypothetical protein
MALGDRRRQWSFLRPRAGEPAQGISLADVQLASAAIGVLAVEPDSERAWETLTALVRA